MASTKPFETHASEYEAWFEKYPFVFSSEVAALKAALSPMEGLHGIEVGLGSGRFAEALSITEGIEPALEMRKYALRRGIEVQDGVAEQLPYADLRFDFVLMCSSISYFNDLQEAFREANRVLKPGGKLVVGFVAKDSRIGKFYDTKRQRSVFYREANFYSVESVAEKMKNAGFIKPEYWQTLFKGLDETKELEEAKTGVGEGSFVVIKAIKKRMG